MEYIKHINVIFCLFVLLPQIADGRAMGETQQLPACPTPILILSANIRATLSLFSPIFLEKELVRKILKRNWPTPILILSANIRATLSFFPPFF